MASRYFARGDRTHAAAEIRAGTAFLKLEAWRHDATNKTGLEDAAKHLDDLAAGVTKGTVKSPKELNDAFVRADLALARHYHQMAEASAARNEHEKTGYWLEGAADSVDDAAEWSGHKLAAGGRATVNGARSLGAKLEGGAKWTADEVKKCVKRPRQRNRKPWQPYLVWRSRVDQRGRRRVSKPDRCLNLFSL